VRQGKPEGGRLNTTTKGQTCMGKGQVAQVAGWLATLKASGCLCLLDGGGIYKLRAQIEIKLRQSSSK